jgi:hypothetical protein
MNKYIYLPFTSSLNIDFIKRTDADGNVAWIPIDESNSDYREYKDDPQQADQSELK